MFTLKRRDIPLRMLWAASMALRAKMKVKRREGRSGKFGKSGY